MAGFQAYGFMSECRELERFLGGLNPYFVHVCNCVCVFIQVSVHTLVCICLFD